MKSTMPPRLMAVPRTLQMRMEIAKAINALAREGEDEYRRRKQGEAAAIRSERRELAPSVQLHLRKFYPNQPRVPAGNPNGGQWSGERRNVRTQQVTRLATRRISPAREAECEEQYAGDKFQCQMVGLSECYAQAMLRYANCLQGLPIPPLNY